MSKSIYGRYGELIGELSGDTYYALGGHPVAYLSRGKVYRFGSSDTICEIMSDGRVYSGSDYIGYQDGDSFYIGAELVATMQGCEPGETAWFGQSDTGHASSSGWLLGFIELVWAMIRYGWPYALASAALTGVGFGVYKLLGQVGHVMPLADWLCIGLAAAAAASLAASYLPAAAGASRLLSRAGAAMLFLSLLIVSMLKLGLIACWAFPLDFLAADMLREGCLSALESCPAALWLYRGFISFTARDGVIILNDGVKGLLDSASALITLATDRLPFIVALVCILPLIFGGLLSVFFAILVFPFICLAIPFIIPFVVCRLVVRLLPPRA